MPVKEAEHLDWLTRLRVATGMAYCLQHMHQLDPPMALIKLNSQAVYLTDDYASKLSDLSFSYDITSAERKAIDMPKATLESNVYIASVFCYLRWLLVVSLIQWNKGTHLKTGHHTIYKETNPSKI